MLRLALAFAFAFVSSLVLVAPAPAQVTTLFPGATYESGIQFTPHGPVAVHIVRGPRPTGLYHLSPVLSNESVTRLESVTSMQRRLSSQTTAVGVNGDFYSFKDGRPSGILLRNGALVSAPNGNRSSTGITFDGTLDVRRVRFFGTWRGLGQRRPLSTFNEAPGANGIGLFTSDWGPSTPRIQGAVSVVLSPFDIAAPNADLIAGVVQLRQSGSVPIVPGTAVLVARGTAAQKLSAEAPLATTVTIRLILQSAWEQVSDAIGGGPVLVKDGSPVFRANEAFTTEQLGPRHPRTAVGQTADGRVLLVTVDGRQDGYSVGMTNFEMAQTLVRLGAVRAMGFDGGGSTTLAFNGTVLNRPSGGSERPVSTALMLLYSGVYSPPPRETVQSPNGDGVDEEQSLQFKIVRPSNVTATLIAPGGSVAYQDIALREPGVYEVPFPPPPPVVEPPLEGEPPPPPAETQPPAEGRWALTVSATDDQGQLSSTTRRFWVNSTLGFLRVRPSTLFLPPAGRSATVSWTQARAANVTATVETMAGIGVRTIAKRRFEAGEALVAWDGRQRDGRVAFGGLYRVRVAARNEIGTVSLEQKLRVRRIAGPKK